MLFKWQMICLLCFAFFLSLPGTEFPQLVGFLPFHFENLLWVRKLILRFFLLIWGNEWNLFVSSGWLSFVGVLCLMVVGEMMVWVSLMGVVWLLAKRMCLCVYKWRRRSCSTIKIGWSTMSESCIGSIFLGGGE